MSDDRPGSPLTKALAAAQAEFPPIGLDAEGQAGPRRYGYASLGAILHAVTPVLSKHGLAVSQRFSPLEAEPGSMFLVSELRHEGGEDCASIIPIPLSGNPQDIGKWITYMRRYSLTALLSLAPGEIDDDAAGIGAPAPGRQEGAKSAPPAAASDVRGAPGSGDPAVGGKTAEGDAGAGRLTRAQAKLILAAAKVRAKQLTLPSGGIVLEKVLEAHGLPRWEGDPKVEAVTEHLRVVVPEGRHELFLRDVTTWHEGIDYDAPAADPGVPF